MPGPAPKPASKRRRANVPKSYGAAEPTVAPAAQHADRQLGIDNAHPLISDMWNAVQRSCESAFYGEADWERLRLELWYMRNRAVGSGRPVSGHTWGAIQHGMNELLLSPAVKRRAGIEMKRAVDEDADAAVSMVGRYKRVLKSV